ncbi:hypothetical protein L1887_44507 [Cichorium endivia]|nr:hypothetical protein L1887_44507 [Cichorium endivia]
MNFSRGNEGKERWPRQPSGAIAAIVASRDDLVPCVSRCLVPSVVFAFVDSTFAIHIIVQHIAPDRARSCTLARSYSQSIEHAFFSLSSPPSGKKRWTEVGVGCYSGDGQLQESSSANNAEGAKDRSGDHTTWASNCC